MLDVFFESKLSPFLSLLLSLRLAPTGHHNQTSKRDERNIIISRRVNVVAPKTTQKTAATTTKTTVRLNFVRVRDWNGPQSHLCRKSHLMPSFKLEKDRSDLFKKCRSK